MLDSELMALLAFFSVYPLKTLMNQELLRKVRLLIRDNTVDRWLS